MAPAAAYDEIAGWYEDEFLARTAAAGADVLGIEHAPRELCGGHVLGRSPLSFPACWPGQGVQREERL
jgi:hypothetical protein